MPAILVGLPDHLAHLGGPESRLMFVELSVSQTSLGRPRNFWQFGRDGDRNQIARPHKTIDITCVCAWVAEDGSVLRYYSRLYRKMPGVRVVAVHE